MEDKELIDQKKLSLKKKTRFYLYIGYLLLLAGVIWLLYSQLGLILIVGGIVMRVLYYIAKMDLKALDSLEKRLKIIFIFLVAFNLISNSLMAFQPGQKAAEISDLKWLKGEAVTIFPKEKKREKIIVIECWASWDKGCQLAIPVLAAIQKKYKDQVIVVAISKEKEEALKKFLDQSGKNISYRIARDGTGSTVDLYNGSDTRIPLTLVVDKSGKVIWRGHPFELDPVLKNITNGTFDLEKQKKISKLQKELQSFLQIEDFKQVINTSEKILAIDPANDIAMRVRLFVFENRKQLPEAIDFICSQITKNPDIVELYFIKLDLMQRKNTSTEELEKEMSNIAEKFKDNADALHQLAWFAVNQIKFGDAPIDLALTSAEKAVELELRSQDQDPVKLANFFNTLAKNYYMAGMIEKAIESQEKTCKLLKDDTVEQEAKQLLDYYKKVLKIKTSKTDL